jgi:hypothetical protein
MPHDIHLTPASRPGHSPRFALGLALVALLVAILASSPAPEPLGTQAADPVHEDWHGNVRRSN